MQAVYKEAQQAGLGRDRYIYSVLLDAYAEAGAAEKVQALFDAMPSLGIQAC